MISPHNKNLVAFREVEKTPLIPPERDAGTREGNYRTWKGVPHAELIKGIVSAAKRAKLQPQKSRQYILMRNGSEMLATVPMGVPESGIQPYLGVVSSNSRRKCLTFYVGGTIEDVPLVVDFFGGVRNFPSWEYVEGFNIASVCDEAISIWKERIERELEIRLNELVDMPLSDSDARLIIMDAATKGLTSYASIGGIWKWWENRKGKTGFDLLSAFTNCWSASDSFLQLEQLCKFQNLIVPTLNRKKVLV